MSHGAGPIPGPQPSSNEDAKAQTVRIETHFDFTYRN